MKVLIHCLPLIVMILWRGICYMSNSLVQPSSSEIEFRGGGGGGGDVLR